MWKKKAGRALVLCTLFWAVYLFILLVLKQSFDMSFGGCAWHMVWAIPFCLHTSTPFERRPLFRPSSLGQWRAPTSLICSTTMHSTPAQRIRRRRESMLSNDINRSLRIVDRRSFPLRCRRSCRCPISCLNNNKPCILKKKKMIKIPQDQSTFIGWMIRT